MSGFSVPAFNFVYQGLPAASGTLNVYQTGTTTPVTIYSDGALVTPLSNPLTLDANGQAKFYYSGNVNLRLDAYTQSGTLIESIDPVYPTGATTIGSVVDQNTNLTLTASNAGNNIIATAQITISLPLTTTLSNSFYIDFNAQSGSITFAPAITDKINLNTAGTNYLIPQGQSGRLWTDAAGNWGINFYQNTPTFTSINGGPLAGFRNRIINGDMRVDQRHLGASQTFTAAANIAYAVDRFYGSCTGANVTGQQVAGTGADQYVYRFTGAASVTGIIYGQRIEATNIYDLVSTTATFSVELANSLLTTVTWTAYYPTATDNYAAKTQIATGTFTVSSTLTKYNVQIALGANITAGLCLELSVGAQISGTWTIGQWQLEPGLAATPLERRPIMIETALCQRYLPAWNSSGSTSLIGVAYVNASTTLLGNVMFNTPSRVPPTGITISGAAHLTASINNSAFISSAVAFSASSNTQLRMTITVSGATGGQGGDLFFNTSSGQLLATGCEL